MNNLYDYYQKFQMPLIHLITDMENRGVKIDVDHANAMHIKYTNMHNEKTLEIYDMVNYKFDIDSPSELGNILFNKLKFKPIAFTPKTNQPKTDGPALKELDDRYDHPIFEQIMDRKSMGKLISTYLLPLVNRSIDGIIHCQFNQTGTKLSRLSSRDPNLQNIPVRSEYAKDIQNIFIAREGYKLMPMDLAGIEMRIFAFLANDENLLKTIYADEDMHAANASLFLNIPIEEIMADKKKLGKTSKRDAMKHAGFAMLYESGQRTVQKTIRNIGGFLVPLTDEEATQQGWSYSIESIYRGFAKRATAAVQWKKKVLKELQETGMVQTLYGRYRRLPNVYSFDEGLKHEAQRQAINAEIQTPAGDICEQAGIRMHLKLKAIDAHLLINVHDSFVAEVPEDKIEESYQIMMKAFLMPFERLDVPLGIEAEIGDRWGDCEYYKETSAIREKMWSKAA